jgi:hypothetical protein
MANPELSHEWQAHLSCTAEQAQKHLNDLEVGRQERLLIEEYRAHAHHFGRVALALMDAVGTSYSNAHDHSERDLLSSLFVTRISNLIPLGPIAESEDKYAFGRVATWHEWGKKEIITPRRFRKPRIEMVDVPSDDLVEMNISYLAGNEDQSELTTFLLHALDIHKPDREALALVEGSLTEFSDALRSRETAE